MEIEIQSKTNNPLLKRTEVHFTICHEGEKTPKRELIRSELAEKLNTKKENIMINFMKSGFGSADTVGYAKVYKSVKDAEAYEKKHVLKRNNVQGGAKKSAKEEPGKPAEQPAAQPEQKEESPTKQEQPSVEKVEEKSVEPSSEEKPAEEKKE